MSHPEVAQRAALLNKVPEVTLGFWATKILSTIVGETGADYLAVHAGLGAGVTGGVMAGLLITALVLQFRTTRCVPWIYWLTVVLISVVGTQITDGLTDGLGVGLYTSTIVFALGLGTVFIAWYRAEKTLSIRTVTTPRRELFYWLAILLTFALGTAAGDLATEQLGIGFQWGFVLFCGLIGATALAWRLGLESVPAFWLVYIVTRPLGASLGDLLSQAQTDGGLGLGSVRTSLAFLVLIALFVVSTSFGRPRLDAPAKDKA